jgi:hypothetical protein
LHKPFPQSHDILYTLSHLLAKHLNPVPAGRSIVSCKKMIMRLKTACSDELAKIKAGIPITGDADSEGKKTPKKPATPKRKKSDADVGGEKDGEEKVTPKKARGRPAKTAAKDAEAQKDVEAEKEEVKEEQVGDEDA